MFVASWRTSENYGENFILRSEDRGQRDLRDEHKGCWTSPAKNRRPYHLCESGGREETLSHQLHPSTLDNLGLVAAAKSFCREISEHNDIVVDLSDRTIPTTLPRDVSLALFRVIQEALHNSLKQCICNGGGRN